MRPEKIKAGQPVCRPDQIKIPKAVISQGLSYTRIKSRHAMLGLQSNLTCDPNM